MRISQTMVSGLAALAMLAVSVAGCGSKPTSSTSTSGSATSATSSRSSAPTSSAPAQPSDYARLLIQATDINAPETFNASPPTNNPNGQPGVATTFSTQDSSHVIRDTIQVLADPAAATTALNSAKAGQGNTIKDPQTGSSNVGTDGTTLSGNSPDGSKGVAICCSPRAGHSSRWNSMARPGCSHRRTSSSTPAKNKTRPSRRGSAADLGSHPLDHAQRNVGPCVVSARTTTEQTRWTT